MRVEEFVGQRVREQRELRGMTQDELGRQLEPLLGKSWPRQAVWAAERGLRAITSAELVALAVALKVQPARLLGELGDLDLIELPSGVSVAEANMPPPVPQRCSEGEDAGQEEGTAKRARTWTEREIRALGVRTDVVTAGSVLGIGRTKSHAMVRSGTFPVQVLRLGRRLVVPVSGLIEALGLAPAAVATPEGSA